MPARLRGRPAERDAGAGKLSDPDLSAETTTAALAQAWRGRSLSHVLADLTARLAAAGIEAAAREAALLAEFALGLDAAGRVLAGADPVTPSGADRLAGAGARRLAREPLGRITGRTGFWTFTLATPPGALIPRPETEHVVEALLAAPRPAAPRILDLGTGSGAILLALMSERPGAFGVGVDASADALAVARANAAALGLADRCAFVQGDWDAALSGPFDLIASNPPYVARAAIDGLAAEVRDHDPRAALDGGPDGLDALRRVAAAVARCAAPGATAAVEIGHDQGAAARALFAAATPERLVAVRRDLAGRDRVVVAGPAPASPVA